MKKLLGIVVLGLLLTGCARMSTETQKAYIESDYIRIGMDFSEFRKLFSPPTLGWMTLYIHNTYPKYMHSSNFAYLPTYSDDISYGFESNTPAGDGLMGYLKGYKLTKIFNSNYEAIEYYLSLNPTNKKQKFELIKYKLNMEKFMSANKSKKKAGKSTTIVPSSGTAFFIDNQGHLITNFHVIKGCNNQSKITYKSKEIKANLVAKDERLDLALLKADVINDLFLKISNQSPKKLQKVIVAGHPLGKLVSDDLKIENGIITALKGPGDDSTLLQTNVAINFGNSGGPIVYEKNGEVVAVAVSGLRKDITEGINFGIKSLSVKNFLESNSMNIPSASNELSLSNDKLVELLEGATLYTFCE